MRRRDNPLPRVVAIRGLLAICAFAGILLLATSLYSGVPLRDYRYVDVSVPLVGNLLAHDAVRIGGARVGQVDEIAVDDDGQPRVRLQLEPGTELQEDTKVVIRANGLLGARYVQLVPGTSVRQLSDGAELRGDARSFTSGLPEAVDTFDRPTRHGLQQTLDELGAGLLANGGSLNESVRGLAIGTSKFDSIARAILARDGAARRLIPAFDAAVRPAAANKRYVRPGFTALHRAFRPFSSERDAVRSALDQAPAALDSLKSGLGRGTRLLASVGSVSKALDATLPPAPAALGDLAALLERARRPLRRLVPDLEDRLPDTAAAVGVLLGDLQRKLVPKLDQTLELLRPQLTYISHHACDFKNFAASMRSMTSFRQAGEGPAGPAMAFRLVVPAPAGAEVAGIDANGALGLGLYKRVGYEAPCTYLSKPYPQLTKDPLALTTPGQGPGDRP